MELNSKWHETRANFGSNFYDLTKDEKFLRSSSGKHKREWFKGNFGGEGGSTYLNIQANAESSPSNNLRRCVINMHHSKNQFDISRR
jgi:hypothetical protein